MSELVEEVWRRRKFEKELSVAYDVLEILLVAVSLQSAGLGS